MNRKSNPIPSLYTVQNTLKYLKKLQISQIQTLLKNKGPGLLEQVFAFDHAGKIVGELGKLLLLKHDISTTHHKVVPKETLKSKESWFLLSWTLQDSLLSNITVIYNKHSASTQLLRCSCFARLGDSLSSWQVTAQMICVLSDNIFHRGTEYHRQDSIASAAELFAKDSTRRALQHVGPKSPVKRKHVMLWLLASKNILDKFHAKASRARFAFGEWTTTKAADVPDVYHATILHVSLPAHRESHPQQYLQDSLPP